jgi:D-alanyl-D-alanine dipeptidase
MTIRVRFADTPIPASRTKATSAYRRIDFMESAYAAEPLVPLQDYGMATDAYYARSDGLNPPYNRPIKTAEPAIRVRRSVAERLSTINKRLARSGLELLVLDGFRSLACQRELWYHFLRRIRRASVGATPESIESVAVKYIADPRGFKASDSKTWTSHITGGAVDLTLRRRAAGSREWLFMGGIFDDPSIVSHTAYFEKAGVKHPSDSFIEARKNRRILYWHLVEGEFVNLSTEWWHYDWGTQLWALQPSSLHPVKRQALYRPIF